MPGLKEREGKKVALHRIEPGSTDTNGYRSDHLFKNSLGRTLEDTA